MTEKNYDAVLAKTLAYEGGYSNNPSDPGGPTNFGITIADARAYWKPDATAADVKAMPLSVAKDIYRKHYWIPVRGDELPDGVDLAVFDYGVNSGVSRSAKVLQRLTGSPVDGVIGPKTVASTGAKDPVQLVKDICQERLSFLKGLKTWSVFGKGWGSRVADVQATGVKMALSASGKAPQASNDTLHSHAQQHASTATKGAAGAIVTAGSAAAAAHTLGLPHGVLLWLLGAAALAGIAFALWHIVHNIHQASAYTAAAKDQGVPNVAQAATQMGT